MNPLIGSTLLKVGGSLLGGLFGRKKQTQSSVVDFQALRDRAEAAGFNPLTALRATGGAGFQQTTTPGLSTGEFLAEALGAAGDGWAEIAKANDPMVKKRDELEIELMQQELDRMKRSTGAVQGFAGGVPSSDFYSSYATAPRNSEGALATASSGFDVAPGRGIPGDADLLTADSGSEFYGEMTGEGIGLRNSAAILSRDYFDPMREEEYDGAIGPKQYGIRQGAKPRPWTKMLTWHREPFRYGW